MRNPIRVKSVMRYVTDLDWARYYHDRWQKTGHPHAEYQMWHFLICAGFYGEL